MGPRAAFLLLAVTAFHRSSCGASEGAVRLGGPCQRSSDCEGSDDGLAECLKGVCEPPDAGPLTDGGAEQ